MNTGTDYRIGYPGTTIFVILLFLLFAAFNQNKGRSDNTLRVQYQLSFANTPAVSSENSPQLTCEQIFKALIKACNHGSEYNTLRIKHDNRLLNQRVTSLHKGELIIKPPPQGFYYHHQSLSSEDLPVSS